MADVVARVRAICLALEGVEERASHGVPGFFAGRQFAHVWPDGHHGDAGAQLWCAAPAGAQAALVAEDPDRFFVPPYVGARGWVGVRLTGRVDWPRVADLVGQARDCVGPSRPARPRARAPRSTRTR